ncbi:MAG TPA: hypothetical protein VHM26_08580 [Chitinophagaceae bacterium]|jgi:hypothetical protein|nr:hypothetical protein [Chitinophagaceae bacterium]
MQTHFCIKLNLKTPTGYETFGKFSICENSKTAHSIFSKLKGTSKVDERNVLYIELCEMKDELPLNVQMLTCTLDELAENCRIITREIFKLHNLGIM